MTAEQTRKILLFTSALYGVVFIPAAMQVPSLVGFLTTPPVEGESRNLLLDGVIASIAFFPISIVVSIGLSWFFFKKERLGPALLLAVLPLVNILVVWGGSAYAQYTLSQWLN